MAHPGDAALVHQVHDELELVEALEVGDLGLVPGVGEGLEALQDELGGATAEHGLFAEQVGLGLLLEGGLDDPGAGEADAGRVGLGELERVAGGVLVDGDQAGRALALLVQATDDVAGRLRGGEEHVDVRGGLDEAEVDVEPVAEDQGVAGLHGVGQPVLPRGLLGGVGQQHDDDVGLGGRLVGRLDREASLLGDRPRGGALAQPDADVDAGVAQVQGVGVALRAVAEDGDLLRLDDREVGVLLVVDRGHGRVLVCGMGRVAKRTTRSATPGNRVLPTSLDSAGR